MPEITSNFTLEMPPDIVWESFKDVRLVAECMPGVELAEQKDDSTYTGTLKTKVGAMSASFEGEATIVEQDDEARKGRIDAKGVDRRGGSRASATVDYHVEETPTGASVSMVAEIKLQGALAQFGRSGLLQDISDQLVGEFADTLKRRISAATPEEAALIRSKDVRPVVLLLRSLWLRIKRLFGGGKTRPGPRRS